MLDDPRNPENAGNPYEEIAGIIDAALGDGSSAPPAIDGQGDGAVAPETKAEPRDWGYSVEAMNAEWSLVLLGSKAVMMREQPNAPIEDRSRVLSVDAFKAWHLNRLSEVCGADGKIKVTTWASRWLGDRKRRQYAGIEFAPGADAPTTAGYYNLWRGFSANPRETGSWSIFRDHLLTNVCGGDPELFRWLFAWFARIFQRPRERVGTAIVLRGCMGSGKTKVGEIFGSLIPSHYFMVDDPRYVTGQFNAHMASCLLLQAEEAVWAGDKAAEGRLKGLITSKFQMIEQKGIDPIRIENFVNLVMTSNEGWVVPAGKDERRFCVLDVAPHVAQNHEYFAAMDAELADGGRERLLHDLMTFDLADINLRQIPKTGALLEQKLRSLEPVDAWWHDRLWAGAPTRGASEWPGSVQCSALFDDYIATADRIGVKRRSFETEMGTQLFKIVPGLAKRREYGTDGRRVWAYTLPSLADARAGFAAALGQDIAWPSDDAPVVGQTERIDG